MGAPIEEWHPSLPSFLNWVKASELHVVKALLASLPRVAFPGQKASWVEKFEQPRSRAQWARGPDLAWPVRGPVEVEGTETGDTGHSSRDWELPYKGKKTKPHTRKRKKNLTYSAPMAARQRRCSGVVPESCFGFIYLGLIPRQGSITDRHISMI